MPKKDKDPGNIPPKLARKFVSLQSHPNFDFEGMPKKEFEKIWTESGISVSDESRQLFSDLVEFHQGRANIETARKLRRQQQAKQNSEELSHRIASISKLTIQEVIARIKALTKPETERSVFARGLENKNEEDLRSLLLDLERLEENETSDKKN